MSDASTSAAKHRVAIEELESKISTAKKLLTKLESKMASNLKESYEKSAVKIAPRIGAEISKAASRGRLEEMIPVVVLLSVPWAAASVIDGARNAGNHIAKRNVKNKLVKEYYPKLIAEQGLLEKCLQQCTEDQFQRLLETEHEIDHLESLVRETKQVLVEIKAAKKALSK